MSDKQRIKDLEAMLDDMHRYRYGENDRRLEWRGIYEENGHEACKSCSGSGGKLYGSTATWKRGIGGQAMTHGVCDICWGSGRSDRPWLNLKELK